MQCCRFILWRLACLLLHLNRSLAKIAVRHSDFIMKIHIDKLKTLPHERLELEFKETLPDLQSTKPVLGKLTASMNASGVTLSGSVKTLLKLECHRCLSPYFESLNVDIDERFVYQSMVVKEGELLRDDFVEEIPPDGILDIGDIVYQAVTLAMPTSFFCGSHCPGPPTSKIVSGGELDVDRAILQQERAQGDLKDPRWKNLKTLFPKEEAKENS